MGGIASAWWATSWRQKTVIIGALLIAVVAVASLTRPSDTTPVGLAQPTATPPATPLSAASALTATPTLSETASAVSTLTRVPKPTGKPTVEPTPKPTLTLTFTSLTSPVAPGSFATATVRTKPGAYCTIVVRYKSGPSKAAGLGPMIANASGTASWTWKAGTRTTPGSWPVTVTCSSGGASKSATRYLKVV